MRPADPNDPLLRQILPVEAEDRQVVGFTADPVGEVGKEGTTAFLHKYAGRALIVATGRCAIHCRYCFRRHFPYPHAGPENQPWEEAIEMVADDRSIAEVILSGGDPLTLVDPQISKIFTCLEAIPHVKRVRIHTRLPIVLPSRVTDSLCQQLVSTSLSAVMVLHANHAQELAGNQVESGLVRLSRTGVPLLNQAVLLQGVNDNFESQRALCLRLVDLGVIPYYLHQLDRVAGAAHFEVEEETGVALIERLRSELPGYAVPRFVREVAGEGSKRVIC